MSYHLYNISTEKAGSTVNLIRKSKWHSEFIHEEEDEGINNFCPLQTHLTYLTPENFITGFDFNPSGEIVAAIDPLGTCRISEALIILSST